MSVLRVAWLILHFQLCCFALEPAPPLDLISIPSINPTTPGSYAIPFGLQNAFNRNYNSTNGVITMFSDACNQSDGTSNCTAACLNSTQMFSSLETLHNCALFPLLSVRLANGTLSTDARSLAEKLKIEPSSDHSSLPSNISNTIQTCLLDSCHNNTDCAKTLNPIHGSNRGFDPNNLTGILFIDSYFPLCSPIPAHINADVGGIGVRSKLCCFLHDI